MVLTSKNLVEEDLDVIRGEVLWGHDDLVQVALKKFRDNIAKIDLVKEISAENGII